MSDPKLQEAIQTALDLAISLRICGEDGDDDLAEIELEGQMERHKWLKDRI